MTDRSSPHRRVRGFVFGLRAVSLAVVELAVRRMKNMRRLRRRASNSL